MSIVLVDSKYFGQYLARAQNCKPAPCGCGQDAEHIAQRTDKDRKW